MKDQDIEAELQKLLSGQGTARETIARLAARGVEPLDAQQFVFCALGGSDVVEVGDDGRERYQPSGKLVREIAAALMA